MVAKPTRADGMTETTCIPTGHEGVESKHVSPALVSLRPVCYQNVSACLHTFDHIPCSQGSRVELTFSQKKERIQGVGASRRIQVPSVLICLAVRLPSHRFRTRPEIKISSLLLSCTPISSSLAAFSSHCRFQTQISTLFTLASQTHSGRRAQGKCNDCLPPSL